MKQSERLRVPIFTWIFGLIIGVVFGLFVLGWWLWPVKWINALPVDLTYNEKVSYLRMSIEAFGFSGDVEQAKTQYASLGGDANAAMVEIAQNPAGLPMNLIASYNQQVAGLNPQEVTVNPPQPVPVNSLYSPLLGVLAALVLIGLTAFLTVIMLRQRREETKPSVVQEEEVQWTESPISPEGELAETEMVPQVVEGEGPVEAVQEERPVEEIPVEAEAIEQVATPSEVPAEEVIPELQAEDESGRPGLATAAGAAAVAAGAYLASKPDEEVEQAEVQETAGAAETEVAPASEFTGEEQAVETPSEVQMVEAPSEEQGVEVPAEKPVVEAPSEEQVEETSSVGVTESGPGLAPLAAAVAAGAAIGSRTDEEEQVLPPAEEGAGEDFGWVLENPEPEEPEAPFAEETPVATSEGEVEPLEDAIPISEAIFPAFKSQPAEEPEMDFERKMGLKLDYVEGIGEIYAGRLESIGISTTGALLERGSTRRGRQEVAELSGISEKLILKWVNHIDLYRIKGVGSEYADLLEASGVDTIPELALRNPDNLYEKMVAVNEQKRLVRKVPVYSQVADWVESAKSLPRMIQY